MKITLYTCTDEQVGDPQFTNADGNYLFTNLVPACYYVIFDPATLPEGFSFTMPNGTGIDDALDSDADAGSGKTPSVTLNPGQVYLDLDADLLPGQLPPTNDPEGEQPRELIFLPTLHHE